MSKRKSKRQQERVAFGNLLERMGNVERDKDAFLKAARLKRTEREPMLDGEQVFFLICLVIGVLSFLGFIAMMGLT